MNNKKREIIKKIEELERLWREISEEIGKLHESGERIRI